MKKPNGHWHIKETCQEEALKYQTKIEFRKGSGGAYNSALRNKWMDEICSHMELQIKPKGYWTFERCKKEALKYDSRGEFSKGSYSAYNFAIKNDCLDEICSHMEEIKKPNGHWHIKETCQEEALKYDSLSEFNKGCRGAYSSASENKWLDEICSHMIEIKKPNGYWTFETCQEEAKKYKTRSEFQKGSAGAYNSAREKKWLDEICSHMEIQGSDNERFLYAAKFDDGAIYIGLTFNLNTRMNEHLTDTTCVIYKHIKKTGLIPIFELIDGILYPKEEASKLEKKLISDFRKNKSFLLNVSSGGQLGGNKLMWTKDKCKKEALKYKSRSEFKKGSAGAYDSALNNKWLNEICSHMELQVKPTGYWTFETCQEEASKYKTRSGFQKGSGGAYNSARENKWLNEICSHMGLPIKPNGYWDVKETCQKEASKYKTRSEFNKGCKSAYNSALRNKWMDEFFPCK